MPSNAPSSLRVRPGGRVWRGSPSAQLKFQPLWPAVACCTHGWVNFTARSVPPLWLSLAGYTLPANASGSAVVVMARAHEETIRCVVQAGQDFGVKVMGDNLGCEDMVAGARRLEELGCDFIIHHIGYDERRGIAARERRRVSPLDQLREVVAAVSVPVQAVGGLSLEQAVATPEYGAPLVVLGAPLTIDADAFKTASGDVESSLRLICEKVHAYGDIPVGRKS